VTVPPAAANVPPAFDNLTVTVLPVAGERWSLVSTIKKVNV